MLYTLSLVRGEEMRQHFTPAEHRDGKVEYHRERSNLRQPTNCGVNEERRSKFQGRSIHRATSDNLEQELRGSFPF